MVNRKSVSLLFCHTTYFLNILIIFNFSNIDKEVNKELREDDLINIETCWNVS